MLELIIFLILLSATISFYRVIKGPSVLDRIAAVSAIGIMMLIILVIMGVFFSREIYLDVALVYGLLLFIDILVMAKYFGSPKKRRESESDS
ncbi:monovalent cation/H+ antiporter complex subunit F [Halarsenatibacter silvermanii]|uniref:Multicomponent Na+:H+ antiporter subunit F n=1 Tax=Halarsenatibacter silvermanii TaxID=321763 RepID=A0A1G9KHI3_9FIRM|nr:monovalent cation/H+ antiporter complex subunit F [Halarsenatibacter silvermanii]SDL48885.1 multicomponent Na+:H+ antiporter subunit F [Halarsenatibacter silvermanii]